jgi:DNA-binding transcriptional LysR family regulator
MELDRLEALVAVADAGTITAAARHLHLSQSALSRRLQQLEAELGTTLLVRGRSGVELTATGRQTVAHARAIVARCDELRRRLGELRGLETGTLRVGGGATATSYLLPPAIATFGAEHPGVGFYVKEAGSREVAEQVASGSLDLGVVTRPVEHPEVAVEELVADRVVLIASRHHPLAGRPVTPAQLEGQTLIAFEPGSAIRRIIDRHLAEAGVEFDVVMELRSIPTIVRMVAATTSLAFVSQLSVGAQPDVAVIAVAGLAITRTLGLATRLGFPLSAAAEAFADTLRRTTAAAGLSPTERPPPIEA